MDTLLLVLGGVLLGGTWSLHSQGAPRLLVALVAAAALTSLVASVVVG